MKEWLKGDRQPTVPSEPLDAAAVLGEHYPYLRHLSPGERRKEIKKLVSGPENLLPEDDWETEIKLIFAVVGWDEEDEPA